MNPLSMRSLSAASAALLLAAIAAAQQAAATAPALHSGAAASIRRSAHGLTADGDTLTGAGPAYTATFTAGGCRYTPALGTRAPRDLPLALALESIRRGDAAFCSGGTVPAAHDGNVVRCERAGGVTERFTVRADGVELSYRFAQAPRGHGDLVVRARIETDLRAEPAADGTLRFLAGGLGGVSIGAVTGIDADGRQARGGLRLDGDHLELSLPASFVDAAAYPLVLDPLVGTEIGFAVSASDDDHPAAAYDLSSNSWLVAWQHAVSTGSVEIRAQGVTAAGSPTGPLSVLTSSGVNARPTVANVDVSNRWFVAWQNAPSQFGPWNIQARALNAAGTLSPTVTLASAAGDETDPVSAGSTGTASTATVVWQEAGNGVHGVRVQVPTNGSVSLLGPTAMLFGNVLAHSPAISRAHGPGARVVVAVIGDRIYLRAFDPALVALATEQFLVDSPGLAVSAPDVDGDGTDFVVVYQREESAGSPYRDVRGRALHWSGTTFTAPTANLDLDADTGQDEADPAIALVGPKFVALWAESTAAPLGAIVRGAELTATCTDCGNRFTLDGIGALGRAGRPAIAAQRAGGATGSPDALILFEDSQTVPPFDSDIVIQRHAAYVGTPPVTLGPGCGTGAGTAGIDSPFAIGNIDFHFRVTGATPGWLGFLSLSLGGPPLVCGVCALINPNSFELKGVVPGTGSLSSPLPLVCGHAAFLGISVESQWVFVGGSAVLCPLAAGLSASTRLRVTLAF